MVHIISLSTGQLGQDEQTPKAQQETALQPNEEEGARLIKWPTGREVSLPSLFFPPTRERRQFNNEAHAVKENTPGFPGFYPPGVSGRLVTWVRRSIASLHYLVPFRFQISD